MPQPHLESALREILARLPKGPNGHPSKAATKRDISSLLFVYGIKSRYQNDLFKTRKAPDRKAVREIARHAEAIVSILQGAPLSVLVALRDWHGTADRAEAIERDSAAALTVIERRKVGGLRKEYAQKIEQRAAEIFECHTGKSATLNVRSS